MGVMGDRRSSLCGLCGRWHTGHCSKRHYAGLDAANARAERMEDDEEYDGGFPPRPLGARLASGMAFLRRGDID